MLKYKGKLKQMVGQLFPTDRHQHGNVYAWWSAGSRRAACVSSAGDITAAAKLNA